MNKRLYILILIFFALVLSVNSQEKEIDPNGFNQFYYPQSGQVKSEGNMKNGVPVGEWKNYFKDGTLKSEGKRNDEGLLDDLWTFYGEDSCMTRQITYKNDQKNGLAIQYDSAGTVAYFEHYKEGVLHGERQYFYPNGNIKKIEEFKNGVLQGRVVFFAEEDGRVVLEKRFQDGEEKSATKLNRVDEKGNKTGFWRDYYDNGVIKQEGFYRKGKADGIFKDYNKKGELEGLIMYEDGVLKENAEETELITMYREYHPDGSIKLIGGQTNGIKDGVFREYDKKGNIINGYIYKKGKLMGEGKISADGVYQGDWVEYYENGEVKYKGTYDEDGLRTGDWIFYFRNGEVKQKGAYKEGKPSKQWTWYYQNGQVKRTEYYRGGRRDGLMIEYDSLGNEIVTGNYLNGYKEGEWHYKVGDHEEIGEYSMDLKQGEWKHYYLDGTLAFKGKYKDGLPIGKHVYYHANGKVMKKGKYVRGKKDRRWVEFHPDGQLFKTKLYDNGRLIMIDGVRITENQFE